MNLLKIGKRSLGTVATGRVKGVFGSIPLASNPLFLGPNNSTLSKYYPQKRNVSMGEYIDIEDKKEGDEDNNDLGEIVGNILTGIDNLADGVIDSIKRTIPYIDDFASGNLKYPDMLNKLRTDINYKYKDSLKFIEDRARIINTYKVVSSVATVLGYVFAVEAGVQAVRDNPNDNWIEKSIRFVNEPIKVWISSAAAVGAVTGAVAGGIIAAPETGGASLLYILESGAIATVAYNGTFHVLDSFDPIDVIERPFEGISDGVNKAFVEPVVNSEIYQSVQEKTIGIMLDIEEELRRRFRLPDLLQPGWSY